MEWQFGEGLQAFSGACMRFYGHDYRESGDTEAGDAVPQDDQEGVFGSGGHEV